MSKLKCKGCKHACCDNIVLELCKGVIGPDPEKLPTGAWIYECGIYFIKKSDGRWRCRAFDPKKKLCKIYEHRPVLCRWFKCPNSKKTKPVRMPDNSYDLKSRQYSINLFVPKKGGR